MDRIDYSELEHYFGTPEECKKHMVKKPFPFQMYASWDNSLKISSFYGNAYIANDVIKALQEIYNYYGHDYIKRFGLDQYGGCAVIRKSRGSKRYSTHSWGMAIDYAPQLGEYGIPSMMPSIVVDIFREYGFDWGGNWAYPDGMHFSAVNE